MRIEPGPLDILHGRNTFAQQNLGNRRFRAIIVVSFVHYRAASTRALKSKLVKSVMEDIMSVGARFIKYEKDKWSIIDDEKLICNKIGHALRAHSAVHRHMIVEAKRFMAYYGFQSNDYCERIFDAKQESYPGSSSEDHVELQHDPKACWTSCNQVTTTTTPNCPHLSLFVQSEGRLIFPLQAGKEWREDPRTIPLKPDPLMNHDATMREEEYLNKASDILLKRVCLTRRNEDLNDDKAPSFRDQGLFATCTVTPLNDTRSEIERSLEVFEQSIARRFSIACPDT